MFAAVLLLAVMCSVVMDRGFGGCNLVRWPATAGPSARTEVLSRDDKITESIALGER